MARNHKPEEINARLSQPGDQRLRLARHPTLANNTARRIHNAHAQAFQ